MPLVQLQTKQCGVCWACNRKQGNRIGSASSESYLTMFITYLMTPLDTFSMMSIRMSVSCLFNSQEEECLKILWLTK